MKKVNTDDIQNVNSMTTLRMGMHRAPHRKTGKCTDSFEAQKFCFKYWPHENASKVFLIIVQ